MKLPSINFDGVGELAKAVVSNTKKSAPGIMIAIGVVGLIADVALTWKASRKVEKDIKKVKEEQKKEELTVEETVKATWKTVLPVALVTVSSVGCIMGGYNLKCRRMDAVVTAATLSASTLKQYQESVVKTVGKKKEKEIKADMAQTQVDKMFDSNISEDDIVVTGRGNQLFCDRTQNCLFYSDREFVARAFNNLNMRMRDEMYVTLADYYDALGLPHTHPAVEDQLGWCIDDGYIEPDYEAIFTKDGRTCAVIEFLSKGPTYIHGKMYGYA